VRNAIAVQVSGLACLLAYKVLAIGLNRNTSVLTRFQALMAGLNQSPRS
jgi:hypothetical protein